MNMNEIMNPRKTLASHFFFKNGRLHFSKEIERKVFFFMTMAMLLAGIGVKLGLF